MVFLTFILSCFISYSQVQVQYGIGASYKSNLSYYNEDRPAFSHFLQLDRVLAGSNKHQLFLGLKIQSHGLQSERSHSYSRSSGGARYDDYWNLRKTHWQTIGIPIGYRFSSNARFGYSVQVVPQFTLYKRVKYVTKVEGELRSSDADRLLLESSRSILNFAFEAAVSYRLPNKPDTRIGISGFILPMGAADDDVIPIGAHLTFQFPFNKCISIAKCIVQTE
ncbi:MAG: hypothetical protein JXR19_07035 [Bacteroidia bacterium]